tara:strand:- start:35 stop:295 length:261 start_codon:yes stop_codon:yes gene_type:complete
MIRQRLKHCGKCNKTTTYSFDEPNHILHLLLSLITAGCWVPIWLLIVISGGFSLGKCVEHSRKFATKVGILRIIAGAIYILFMVSL